MLSSNKDPLLNQGNTNGYPQKLKLNINKHVAHQILKIKILEDSLISFSVRY